MRGIGAEERFLCCFALQAKQAVSRLDKASKEEQAAQAKVRRRPTSQGTCATQRPAVRSRRRQRQGTLSPTMIVASYTDIDQNLLMLLCVWCRCLCVSGSG